MANIFSETKLSRQEIIENSMKIAEKVKACKTLISGLEIIKETFGSYIEGSISSDVESSKYNDILYTDIRFTIGNTVCFEFTAEEDAPLEFLELRIKISDANSSNDIKGHWNIFGIKYINFWETVELDDLYDEIF